MCTLTGPVIVGIYLTTLIMFFVGPGVVHGVPLFQRFSNPQSFLGCGVQPKETRLGTSEPDLSVYYYRVLACFVSSQLFVPACSSSFY